MTKIDSLASSGLNKAGQQAASIGSANSTRIVYPAIVVPGGTRDDSEQNRIRVRIVSINDEDGTIEGKVSDSQENYNSYSGTDRGIRDGSLVMCIPLLPQFFFVKPQPDEMVFVILENALDGSSTRYWIGPIITSKLKLRSQSYEEAVKIFDKTTFSANKKINASNLSVQEVFPQESDVAIQGRNDADLILKSREALLIAGKLNKDTFSVNIKTPSFLKLKQITSTIKTLEKKIYPKSTHNIIIELLGNPGEYIATIKVIYKKENFVMEDDNFETDVRSSAISFLKEKLKLHQEKYKKWNLIFSNISEFEKTPITYAEMQGIKQKVDESEIKVPLYSHGELVSSVLTFYSPRGKFRGEEMKNFEINEDLKSFGKLADSLHPAIFGDESIKLFDLIIRFLLSHTHQPQNPPLNTSISDEIKSYTVTGQLQNLLSNHIRIN